MKHALTAKVLPPLALGGATILTAVRIFLLRTAFDENGLLPPKSGALLLTVLLCAGVFFGLALLCLRLNRLPGGETCFADVRWQRFPRLAAAVMLFCGCAMLLLDREATETLAERLVAIGGLLAALGMTWTAVSTRRGPGLFWCRLLPALFSGAALTLRFQGWNHDPLIIRITPPLLAWVCCMVETMLLTGFPLKAGHRRSSVLFGLCAGIFTCMTMADYLLGQSADLSEALILLGLALWCVTAALELLRPQVQEEPAAELPDASGEAQPSDAELAQFGSADSAKPE